MRPRVFPRCSEAIADTHLPHGRLALLPRLRCHGNQSTVYGVPVFKDTSFRDDYCLLISGSLIETATHAGGAEELLLSLYILGTPGQPIKASIAASIARWQAGAERMLAKRNLTGSYKVRGCAAKANNKMGGRLRSETEMGT